MDDGGLIVFQLHRFRGFVQDVIQGRFYLLHHIEAGPNAGDGGIAVAAGDVLAHMLPVDLLHQEGGPGQGFAGMEVYLVDEQRVFGGVGKLNFGGLAPFHQGFLRLGIHEIAV